MEGQVERLIVFPSRDLLSKCLNELFNVECTCRSLEDVERFKNEVLKLSGKSFSVVKGKEEFIFEIQKIIYLAKSNTETCISYCLLTDLIRLLFTPKYQVVIEGEKVNPVILESKAESIVTLMENGIYLNK